MLFFAGLTLPGTHQRDVILYALKKIGRGLLREGKQREGVCVQRAGG